MLHTHLIAKTRPTANPQNILFWHDYRITVLDDRLFRIENSTSHQYVDQATNAVWFRDMPPVDYTTMGNEDSFHIIKGYKFLTKLDSPLQYRKKETITKRLFLSLVTFSRIQHLESETRLYLYGKNYAHCRQIQSCFGESKETLQV